METRRRRGIGGRKSNLRWWDDICKIYWRKRDAELKAVFRGFVGDVSSTDFWSNY